MTALRSGARIAGAVLTASLLAACGGAVPESHAPTGSVGKPSGAATAAKIQARQTPKDAEEVLIATIENARPTGSPASRPEVVPIPFRISDLPVAHLPLDPDPAGVTSDTGPLTESGSAEPIVVTSSGGQSKTGQITMVSIKDAVLATVHVGQWTGFVATTNPTGGASVLCGDGAVAYASPSGRAPLSWESLQRSKAGGIEFTVGRGWFDVQKCKAGVDARGTTAVRAVVPSLVYAFRNCGTTCAERESVVFLLPRPQAVVAEGVGGESKNDQGIFQRVTVPVRRGGGGSMMARIARSEIDQFKSGFDKPADQAATPTGPPTTFLTIEVVQAIDDAQPVAVAYVESPESAAASALADPQEAAARKRRVLRALAKPFIQRR